MSRTFSKKIGRSYNILTEKVEKIEKSKRSHKRINEDDLKIKDISKQEVVIDEQLKSLLDKLETTKGPFKTKFDDTMNSMKLNRHIYHKGALNGNDIAKLSR